MILGLGTDVVAVARIADLVERYGDRFLDRCFRAGERASVEGRIPAARAAGLAARWAAKEAFLKALGTDVRTIPYRDVEVVRHPRGPLELRGHGRAAAMLEDRGGGRILVTISHEREVAVATVVIESGPCG